MINQYQMSLTIIFIITIKEPHSVFKIYQNLSNRKNLQKSKSKSSRPVSAKIKTWKSKSKKSRSSSKYPMKCITKSIPQKKKMKGVLLQKSFKESKQQSQSFEEKVLQYSQNISNNQIDLDDKVSKIEDRAEFPESKTEFQESKATKRKLRID